MWKHKLKTLGFSIVVVLGMLNIAIQVHEYKPGKTVFTCLVTVYFVYSFALYIISRSNKS